ncbi:MAG: hypothetical protein MMC23_003801 [Stictis urceolatum]|nr:hypothetical protein [Stictis urceolata]
MVPLVWLMTGCSSGFGYELALQALPRGDSAGGAGYGLHSAIRVALAGLPKSLEEELELLGIDVVVIEPGYFRTNFVAAADRTAVEREIRGYEGLGKG